MALRHSGVMADTADEGCRVQGKRRRTQDARRKVSHKDPLQRRGLGWVQLLLSYSFFCYYSDRLLRRGAPRNDGAY